MEEASQFIRHLARIERFRIYTPTSIKNDVAAELTDRWTSSA